MTQTWLNLFVAAFILQMIYIVILILQLIGVLVKEPIVTGIGIVMYMISMVASLLWGIVATIMRFSNDGQIIAGDQLTLLKAEATGTEDIYMWSSG